jgi:septum formation protein
MMSTIVSGRTRWTAIMISSPRVSFPVTRSRPLVLASGSPRRAELLTAAGIPFIARAANVDESIRPGELPEAYARRVADAKALAVHAAVDLPHGPDTIILAADTIVVIDALTLGKPNDAAEATRMLERLSGRMHSVITATTLVHAGGLATDLTVTQVTFHPVSAQEIAWYVASGEPLDKAGAYGIQGLASRFVARLDGSYSNVVGLPMDVVYQRRIVAFEARRQNEHNQGVPATAGGSLCH